MTEETQQVEASRTQRAALALKTGLDKVQDQLLVDIKAQGEYFLTVARKHATLVVKDGDSAGKARDYGKECDASAKGMNQTRLDLTEPIRVFQSVIKHEVDQQIEPILEIKVDLNARAMKWQNEENARQRELERKAEEKRREEEEKARKEEDRRRNISIGKGGTGENITPVAEPEPVAAPPKKATVVRTRDHWTIEVLDLDQVPREFLMADMVKLRKAVNGKDRVSAIPGCEVEYDPIPL